MMRCTICRGPTDCNIIDREAQGKQLPRTGDAMTQPLKEHASVGKIEIKIVRCSVERLRKSAWKGLQILAHGLEFPLDRPTELFQEQGYILRSTHSLGANSPLQSPDVGISRCVGSLRWWTEVPEPCQLHCLFPLEYGHRFPLNLTCSNSVSPFEEPSN
jgi:hypothetical protein